LAPIRQQKAVRILTDEFLYTGGGPGRVAA
jgi:hypothetical protein